MADLGAFIRLLAAREIYRHPKIMLGGPDWVTEKAPSLSLTA